MIKRILKDYFSFNSRERIAIILLCCLMAFFWVLPEFYPDNISAPVIESPHKTATGALEETDTTNNLATNLVIQSDRKTALENVFRGTLFAFNPNTISAKDWQKLGLREKTTNTILHYLQKGGRFRKAEDLKKIWGMSATEAERLIPYVRIPVTLFKEYEPQKKQFENTVPVIEKKQVNKININQASISDWGRLPGIGKVLAGRIVKFRNKLGGFTSINQLGKTYGLSDSVFQTIQPYLIFETENQ